MVISNLLDSVVGLGLGAKSSSSPFKPYAHHDTPDSGRISLCDESLDTDDSVSETSSDTESLTIEEFSAQLAALLTPVEGDATPKSSLHLAAKHSDKVEALFRRLTVPKEDGWDRYAFFDPLKPYTRNLVATDHQTFTLLLLCWTPGKESPIHDHPCDGCWVQVLEGSAIESRYIKDSNTDELKCTKSEEFKKGDLGYINDYMGYHKMGNASSTKPAVSLHLYCPPFQSCKIWLNPERASCPSNACVCMHSEYGRRVGR